MGGRGMGGEQREESAIADNYLFHSITFAGVAYRNHQLATKVSAVSYQKVILLGQCF